ncbi:hypothetical protein CVV65_10945 [Kyrpidia spormannii]|uniref:Uncharacterized protein n=1 Tax=Kyrpidia spormannii TaxID=2055160 RepID=A0A2K8N992_9BACL|nr:DUF6114 domain-containing protein [Kyrpidia spormannii]ATY85377.1 hypothetical protein CVV65_10945 [Kyrpidia spormannii]
MVEGMDVRPREGDSPGDGDRARAKNRPEIRAMRRRPRAGLTLVTLAGLLIVWIPANLYWLAFVPGSFAFAGLLFGSLVLACGVVGWIMPRYVRLLGVFAIIVSILSIIGALGGMIIGMLLGIIGGALCVAWSPKDRATSEDAGAGSASAGGAVTLPADGMWNRWFR